MQDDPTAAKMCMCAYSQGNVCEWRDLYVYLPSNKKNMNNKV